MDLNAYTCRICSNSEENISIIAKEMMFGFRDNFTYFECSKCGCLQIDKMPDNIGKFYPNQYAAHHLRGSIKHSFFSKYLKRKRGDHLLGKGSFIGALVTRFLGEGLPWIRYPTITREDHVLDVGCGGGSILSSMHAMGFKHLIGIDPYIAQHVSRNGISIKKMPLEEMSGQFDLITFHHSFEHVFDPLPVLCKATQITRPNKLIIIRIPMMGKYAWRKYGVNWVQLDAPRHFYLHTEKSIQILAQHAGLEIEKVVYESTAFQFIGSELYLQDIPLTSKPESKCNSLSFTKQTVEEYEEKAKTLNILRDGDEACFYLRKK